MRNALVQGTYLAEFLCTTTCLADANPCRCKARDQRRPRVSVIARRRQWSSVPVRRSFRADATTSWTSRTSSKPLIRAFGFQYALLATFACCHSVLICRLKVSTRQKVSTKRGHGRITHEIHGSSRQRAVIVYGTCIEILTAARSGGASNQDAPSPGCSMASAQRMCHLTKRVPGLSHLLGAVQGSARRRQGQTRRVEPSCERGRLLQ